ncbi:monovalent cation/H(+) antiporter subunit G [Olivibacter sp. SDN3]|uniref:monovalent cation/H(+) antiporter subunit G n=1 Tax=Olivibacter sp. SDN3 TaxID=2764720 RepID=UPI001650D634|nr:monovalent cation/H(+) antiporter subunit G [Olivibacter sp. SDN3]QNL49085.1 monovalent cation/H(+) antiporter subunit G [Olivibacter sp. SDN3]
MNTVTLFLSALIIILGSITMLISAIGLVRLPDFYTRLSAVTKNSTLGVILVISGAVLYFNNIEVLLKGLGIIFFIALTSPTSSYVIAKAAIHVKVPFWNKTNLKDFESLEEDQEKD